MTSRLFVTSVVRRAGQASASGFATVLSTSGDVLARAAVPESAHRAADPNPRGGLRGARGVSAWGDRLVVANADRLFVLRPDWRVEREITHPWMGGVHGVLAGADGVWVACTAADLLIQVDWHGRVVADWEWRQDADLVSAFGFGRLPPVDRGVDYRDPDASRGRVRDVVHLNSVARGPDGLLLSFGRVLSPDALRRRSASRLAGRWAAAVGLGRRAAAATPAVPSGTVAGSRYAVVALDGDGRSSVVRMETGTSVPNHDLHLDGDLLVFCDTNRGRLVGVDLATRAIRHAVPIPGEPSFVRGLAPLGGLGFAVGSQRPAAVHRVDLAAETVVASFPLGGHPDESVHTIGRVPEAFDAPTDALFTSP